MAPFDFISMVAERARSGDSGGVVLLRQLVPLRDAAVVREALGQLATHPIVVSTVDGEPCLAFEIRRFDQFSHELRVGIEHFHPISPDTFAEVVTRADEAAAAAKIAAWAR